MPLPTFPPHTTCELDGWELAWFALEPTGAGVKELEVLRAEVVQLLGDRFPGGKLTSDPVVVAVRGLFREAGTDPTRYRPSSEALARRALKGSGLPAIHPLVDLNNLLSLHLMVPCCVVDPTSLQPPFVLRQGRPGESMLSFRGPFNLEGKPVLEDRAGPFGTPITDAERVRVNAGIGETWLVVYGVEATGGPAGARRVLQGLLERAPVARITG